MAKGLKKNLANCNAEEFLIQTNKIRKSAEKWLDATDIMGIRKNVPIFEVPDGATSEEVERLMKEHKEKVSAQAKKNLSKIFDAVLEEHPKETLELLALLNFVEPENVNDYRVTDYLANMTKLMEDESVVSFFTSLVRLGQTGILSA